ncbi:MAG: hypothetical protein JW759_01195 [Candidatus Coatesbacteria bacterium]|nr:hypothetical protein [Candidatus Coatesbacteria bacterium]
MVISRSLAVVLGLVLFSSVWFNVCLANETDFTLKYGWPSLDMENRPHWAPGPVWGSLEFEGSINVWEDRLGLLTSLDMRQFELHGISGVHYVNPGTAAERRWEYETDTDVTIGNYHLDMRMYLAKFIKKWSEAELKTLEKSQLAFILGWNWRHYKFDRNVSRLEGQDTDEDLLPWPEETGFGIDHGGAYKMEGRGPEVGLSLDWKLFDEFSIRAMGRCVPVFRMDFFGVEWEESLESNYAVDADAAMCYDFAKLFELTDQRLKLGLGYQYRRIEGTDLGPFVTCGPILTFVYGFKHTW